MSAVLRLDNPLQHYEWGSPTAIPRLVGRPADGQPVAEMWLGAHPAGSSTVMAGSHAGTPLSELVEACPEQVLGSRVRHRFGARLPYLLKVLAADRPLSLQVHPTAARAREGFRREEAAGVPRASAERSYRDAQHKPEMLVALTRFQALCGVRPVAAAVDLLAAVDCAVTTPLRERLEAGGPHVVPAVFRAVLTDDAYRSAGAVQMLADRCRALVAAGSPHAAAAGMVVRLARTFPADPGVVASLLLNDVSLAPAEALFVPPGTLHCYLQGVGLEVMASSDNVLRAGLTSKHVDVAEVLANTSWLPGPPVRPVARSAGDGVWRYDTPAEEFGLVRAAATSAVPIELPGDGPRIVLCLQGDVELTSGAGAARLARGESVLVPDDDGALSLRGTGQVAVAFVP